MNHFQIKTLFSEAKILKMRDMGFLNFPVFNSCTFCKFVNLSFDKRNVAGNFSATPK
jgi:hypothetical protein